jgi:hypothetical protein
MDDLRKSLAKSTPEQNCERGVLAQNEHHQLFSGGNK